MTRYKIIAASGLNVRSMPATVGNTPIGFLPLNSVIEADPPVNGWHRMALSGGGVGIGAAYCSAAYTIPDTITQPPPPTGEPYRIGVHVIGDFDAARAALDAGAPGVVIMHDKTFAVQMAQAFPDRAIVYRAWFPDKITPQQAFDKLAPNPADPPIWFVGMNEDDTWGTSPADIAHRAQWDGELFHRIKDRQPNARYFAGSYSHGAPGGIEDPNGPVVAAARGYTQYWAEGMGMDFHNYTKGRRYTDDPPGDAPIIDPIWYERRHVFWFTNGILDPTKGGGIIHTETGVEAGQGGYNWANYTPTQFARSLRTLRDLGRQPLKIGAAQYASLELMGFVYQFGRDTSWAGYDTRRYLPEYRAFWAEG